MDGCRASTIKPINILTLCRAATVLPVDDRVMPFLKAEDPGMEVFPMVNNSDGANWAGGIVDFLNNPDARALFRRQTGQFLLSGRYRGLMVDFEAFPPSGQTGYVSLLKELSGDLHARGMKLYVAVPPHSNEYDYPAIAAAADGVVLMNYDEHYPGAASGPVASQDWFVQNLNFAKSVIPQEKIICAIANYGYDWVLKPKKGNLPPDVHDSTVSVQDAWLAARDSEEDVNFDDDAMNPHFSYLDELRPATRYLVPRCGDGSESHAIRAGAGHSDIRPLAAWQRRPFSVEDLGHARGCGGHRQTA